MLDSTIFNASKGDYGTNESMLLGQDAGLFDTVNRRFPKIWEFYKSQKSLDWDELEFDFKSCNLEFKTLPKSISDRMIKTLAWQWEADSVAARTLLPVMAPFISAPELQAAWGRVTDNEVLHASTYSEIVRYSFDDPRVVLDEVLKVKEAMQRLSTVSKVLSMAYKRSHQYALGLVPNDQETYNIALLAVAAFVGLERIQFMSSFAVTFAIGETGAFMPIAKSVQRICQDEFEVHQALNREVLRHEFTTKRGKEARKTIVPVIERMFAEITRSELAWNGSLLDTGPQLVGLNTQYLNDWSLYSAGDAFDGLGIKPPPEFRIPKRNPLPYMENWIDMAQTQPAPQEQQNGQYKVNVMQRTDEGKTFSDDF